MIKQGGGDGVSELKAKQAAVEILKRDLGKAETTATRRLELLREIENELAWCPICAGVEPSTGGGIEHMDGCRWAKELGDDS